MTDLLQTLVAGVTTGAIYGLIALGFTIVFNATKVTNFAHGDFVMMGGLISATLVASAKLPIFVAILIATLCVVALAAALDRFGLQLARRRTVLAFAMITIGASVFYRGIMQVLLGRDVVFLPKFDYLSDIMIGDVFIESQYLWILLIVILTSLSLSYLFLRTKIGKAMRAASQDAEAAALCGIEPKRMSLLAFALAGSTGAVAGALVAPVGAAFYEYGLAFGLKGFAAAVLGGFGSPVGALVGGLLIGLAESLSAGYMSSAYKDATSLLILLVFLLIWPSGLLGRVEARRV